ncbi:MAG TPA: hypothetical protein VFM77_13575 [Terriglobales bacterium]|nr:hypothetical protein [Terriglobales bacterium]
MPALIPKALTEQSETLVWVCSDCDKPFSTSHLPNRRVTPNIHGINRDFAHHCRRHHPRTVVVALPHADEQKVTLVDTLYGWLRAVWVD